MKSPAVECIEDSILAQWPELKHYRGDVSQRLKRKMAMESAAEAAASEAVYAGATDLLTGVKPEERYN